MCAASVLTCLFAIDSVSVSLNFNFSLSGDDVGLGYGLMVSHWASGNMFWRWDVFWGNRKAQQRLEDRLGPRFGKHHVVFPAERVQDTW